MKQKSLFTYFIIIFLMCITIFSLFYIANYYALIQLIQQSFTTIHEKTSSHALPDQLYSKREGFRSLTHETTIDNCDIQGTIPDWLKGTYYATGPAQFDLGNTTVKYWYNGLAMVHAFSIAKSNATYKNAFIKGEFYQHCMNQNAFDAGMTDNYTKPSLFSGLTNIFKTQSPYDNASIALWKFNNVLCASSQTPNPIILEPTTLKTLGTFKFNDSLEAHMAIAYPLYDKTTGIWYNLSTQFGTTTSYSLVSYKDNETQRTLLAKISTKNPSFLYTIGMTKKYIILVEPPFIINPLTLLINPSAFMDALEWKPKRGTTFTIINKVTGATVRQYSINPFFMFNIINAYEENNTIIIDIITYKDPTIIQKTQLSHVRSTTQDEIEPSFAYRFRCNLNDTTISGKKISNKHLELPEINKNYLAQDYTYCYGLSSPEPHNFLAHLVKLNIKTGEYSEWKQEGCFANRPTFIQKPGSSQEDDGVIFSLVFDAIKNSSFLLIVDAQSFKEFARINLGHHIPLGTSGYFDIV